MSTETGRTTAFHPLYCYEPCHVCDVRGEHDCSDGKRRLSNLNPGRYGEQHHPLDPENTECQHVYDDDLLIGQQSRPGDLCRNCLEPKQDQTRADKIAACIDPEHVDQWLGPVDSDAP